MWLQRSLPPPNKTDNLTYFFLIFKFPSCLNWKKTRTPSQVWAGLAGVWRAASASCNKLYDSALGLAGMELTFIIAACRVLCSRFVSNTVVIIHQCFGCCWAVHMQHQGFLLNSFWPLQRLGWALQGSGRKHSCYSWPELAKVVIYNM